MSTELDLLNSILNRLDLIYALNLVEFVVILVIFVSYLIYRYFIDL